MPDKKGRLKTNGFQTAFFHLKQDFQTASVEVHT